MVNVHKPWREDGEIEQEMLNSRNVSISAYPADIKVKRKAIRHHMQHERDIKNEDLIERLIDKRVRIMTETIHARILQLEEEIHRLQSQNDKLIKQDLFAQNEQGIKTLERIFKIDENEVYEPKELEGILADYPGPESSVELIRSIRDGD